MVTLASSRAKVEHWKKRRGMLSMQHTSVSGRGRGTAMTEGPVNIYEYEVLAKERLPKPEYDFIAGGATDEITLRRTRAVFDAIMLRPRMLVDISQCDLSTTVLGRRV